MIVELDLYSGPPNPRWTLDAASTRTFGNAVARLETAVVNVKRPAHLGYRGFLVHADDMDLFVGGGHVFTGNGLDARVLVDTDRGIEQWLLASASNHVDERLLRGLPGIG